MTDGAPRGSPNQFESGKPRTARRSRSEARIEDLRQRGGVFVEAVRATRMPMALTDPKLPGNPIVFVNQSFLDLTGYGLEEVLGQQPFFMNGPDTDPKGATRFRQALEQDRDQFVETVQYRKDGSQFVASLFLSAFKDEEGRTLHHFLSWGDVTRRVEAEEDVQSLRQTQAALRASEARYRALFESMDEAYAVVEVLADEAGRWCDFRFLEVNPAFMAHTTMPHPVGQTATELLGTPNPRWAEVYGRVAETGESVRLEEPELTLGRVFDLNVIRLGGPGSRRVAVLFTDVTARKRAEAALQQAAARDAYRIALTDALRAAADPMDAQGAAMRVLGDYLGASRVMYGEADAGSADSFTNHREYRRDPAMPTSLGRHRWDDFGTYVAAEMRAGRTLVVDDVGAHPGHSAADLAGYEAVGSRAYLAVPLVREGRVAAYLAVNHATTRAWTAEEIALTEETAERTWAAVARAWAEESLRESEERLRLVGRATNDAVMDWDLESDTVLWNEAIATVLGHGDAVGRVQADWWRERIHPDDRRAVLAGLEEAMRGGAGSWGGEYRFQRGDGGYAEVVDRASILRGGDGEPRQVVGSLLDISGRKEAERALRKSEERYRLIVENASDYAIIITDPERRITEWLPGAEAVFGWTAAEAVGQLADITFTPRDRAEGAPEREIDTAAREGEAPDVRWHQRKGGGQVFIEGTTTPLRNDDGSIRGFLKIGQDVSERRSAQEALEASDRRMRALATGIPQLVFRSLGSGERIWGSPQWIEYTGMGFEESLGFAGWRAFTPTTASEAWMPGKAPPSGANIIASTASATPQPTNIAGTRRGRCRRATKGDGSSSGSARRTTSKSYAGSSATSRLCSASSSTGYATRWRWCDRLRGGRQRPATASRKCRPTCRAGSALFHVCRGWSRGARKRGSTSPRSSGRSFSPTPSVRASG